MRYALVFPLLMALAGCSSRPQPADLDGVWINQTAIDAALKSGNLREALTADGPDLEWDFNTKASQAQMSNGFETPLTQLFGQADGSWKAVFDSNYTVSFKLSGKDLVKAAGANSPEQHFRRPKSSEFDNGKVGSSFEGALYNAYMGGKWTIVSGPGQGATVVFHANGQLEGMPGADRYALCLNGDCATQSGEADSIWLQAGNQGNAWLFSRRGGQLSISEAVNQANPDEAPKLRAGNLHWVLQQQ